MTADLYEQMARVYAEAHLKYVHRGQVPDHIKVEELAFFMARYGPFRETVDAAVAAGMRLS